MGFPQPSDAMWQDVKLVLLLSFFLQMFLVLFGASSFSDSTFKAKSQIPSR